MKPLDIAVEGEFARLRDELVNLTDGLDGLATGTSIIVLIAYAVISF